MIYDGWACMVQKKLLLAQALGRFSLRCVEFDNFFGGYIQMPRVDKVKLQTLRVTKVEGLSVVAVLEQCGTCKQILLSVRVLESNVANTCKYNQIYMQIRLIRI